MRSSTMAKSELNEAAAIRAKTRRVGAQACRGRARERHVERVFQTGGALVLRRLVLH